MRIVPQSAKLEQRVIGHEILCSIEKAGRVCYQSEPLGAPADFVRMLIKRGHESVLEHVSISVRVVTDRGISHEIVRHRIASYSQESTRYCRYKNEITVIEPSGLDITDKSHPARNFNGRDIWIEQMRSSERAYLDLLAIGVSPQIARSVLPSCLKTELVMTMNLREWRHFLRLRLAPTAHPQMRELAGMILKLLFGTVSVVFEEFVYEK